jgi:hypothetical protein
MKKAAYFLLAVALFANVSLFAQTVPEKATENPLDCALYLLAKDKDAVDTDFLPEKLIKLGRLDDALAVIESEENSYSKVRLLAAAGKQLLDSNKLEEADRMLTEALNILRAEDEWEGGEIRHLALNLLRADREAEALEILEHQEDEEDKALLMIFLAETYSDLGQKEASEKLLDEAFAQRRILNRGYLDYLIVISLKNGGARKTADFLRQTEDTLLLIDDLDERNRAIFNLIFFYFKNNQKEKAFELWDEFSDKEDSKESLRLVLQLFKNKDTANAAALFKKIRLNKEKSGYYGENLVQVYLKFNDLKSALKVAREMSGEVDNERQQSALMFIADKLIEDKKTTEALNVLDLAFQRAGKVAEEHLAEQSIGASPLTRKVQYLRKIKERYFKLNRFEQGLGVLSVLKIRDSHYQDFYAETLIDFVGKQFKTLPRKKIDELLTKAENIFDEDEDDTRRQATVFIAEIYARLGDKPKAVKLLTKVLNEAVEKDYRKDYLLIAAGKVFEEYKLKADDDLRNVLRKFIDD